jgi:hypothetical protein
VEECSARNAVEDEVDGRSDENSEEKPLIYIDFSWKSDSPRLVEASIWVVSENNS